MPPHWSFRVEARVRSEEELRALGRALNSVRPAGLTLISRRARPGALRALESLESVEELQLLGRARDPGDEGLLHVASALPGLRRLRTSLGQAGLQAVSGLRRLVTLEVESSLDTNELGPRRFASSRR